MMIALRKPEGAADASEQDTLQVFESGNDFNLPVEKYRPKEYLLFIILRNFRYVCRFK
jgi:hypothetical protein